MKKAIISDSS